MKNKKKRDNVLRRRKQQLKLLESLLKKRLQDWLRKRQKLNESLRLKRKLRD